MLNALLLNTAMLNAGTPTPSALSAADFDDLEFDSFSLQDGTSVISSDILAFSGPRRDVVTFDIPRADGGGVVSANYRDRHVRVSGVIQAATSTALDALIDTLKRRMGLQEGNLDLKVGGEVRRIKATLANPEGVFEDRQGFHITHSPFKLDFVAVEPFWHALDYDASYELGATSLDLTTFVDNAGTYKAQAVIVLVVSAASAITGLTVSNGANDATMTLTQALAAGDVLVIDAEEKSVTLNGTEIDYSGTFIELEYGSNGIRLQPAGTSMTYDLTVKYRKTYI